MLKRLVTETREERNARLDARDREIMEELLADVSKLRSAGYKARIGWAEGEGEAGLQVQVACDGECGSWVAPLFPLSRPATCQQCLYDSMEAAGV